MNMIYDSHESYLDSIRKYDFMNMDENCRIFSLLSAPSTLGHALNCVCGRWLAVRYSIFSGPRCSARAVWRGLCAMLQCKARQRIFQPDSITAER